MQYWLISVAIDMLRWLNEPLFYLHLMVHRLRNRRIELLVRLQFKHHSVRRDQRKRR